MAPIKLSFQNDFKIDERFGKYPADWVLHRMGDLGDFFGGATPSTQQPSYWNGSINWLVPSDISTLPEEKKYIYDTGDKITESGLAACSAVLLPAGTVTMSSRATLGDCVIFGKEMCTNQGFISCRCNDYINNEYLLYWIRQYKNYISRYAAGTTFLEIGRRQFKKLRIAIPEPQEQALIVGALADIDRAIEVTRKAIDQAGLVKKALMQNLLSGRLKPDGTWRKPDEFYVDEKFGRVPKGWRACAVADPSIADLEPNYDFVKGKEYAFIPMDAIEEGFKGVRQIEYRVIESGGYTRFKNGDILFAKITPCVENGKVALVEGLRDGLGFGSTEFIVISPKTTADNLFLYYQLISGNVHKLAISLMEGTTGRQRIPAKIFRKRIYISIPEDLNEQRKISEKIKTIEKMIGVKQDKITKLQVLKKSLMQNLLTGKIRVQAE
jgi:type I restriction enzyme S subunit